MLKNPKGLDCCLEKVSNLGWPVIHPSIHPCIVDISIKETWKLSDFLFTICRYTSHTNILITIKKALDSFFGWVDHQNRNSTIKFDSFEIISCHFCGWVFSPSINVFIRKEYLFSCFSSIYHLEQASNENKIHLVCKILSNSGCRSFKRRPF